MESIVPSRAPYEIHFRVKLPERVENERGLPDAVRKKCARMADRDPDHIEILEGGFDGHVMTGRVVFPSANAAQKAVNAASSNTELFYMSYGRRLQCIFDIANPDVYKSVRSGSDIIPKRRDSNDPFKSMLPPSIPTASAASSQPQPSSSHSRSQSGPSISTSYSPNLHQPRASTSSSSSSNPLSSASMISPQLGSTSQFGSAPQFPSPASSFAPRPPATNDPRLASSSHDPRRDRSVSGSAQPPSSASMPPTPGKALPMPSTVKGKQRAAATWRSTFKVYPHPKAVGRPRREGEPETAKGYLMVDLPKEDLKRMSLYTSSYCGTDWPDLDSEPFEKAEVSSSRSRQRRWEDETQRYQSYFPKVKLEQAKQLESTWGKVDLPKVGQVLTDADHEAIEASLVEAELAIHRQWANDNALVKLHRVREMLPRFPTPAQQGLALSTNGQEGHSFFDFCSLGTEKIAPPPSTTTTTHHSASTTASPFPYAASPHLPGADGSEGMGSMMQDQQQYQQQPEGPVVPPPLPEEFVEFIVHWPAGPAKESILYFLSVSADPDDPQNIKQSLDFQQISAYYDASGYMGTFWNWHENDHTYSEWLAMRRTAAPAAVLNQGPEIIMKDPNSRETNIYK